MRGVAKRAGTCWVSKAVSRWHHMNSEIWWQQMEKEKRIRTCPKYHGMPKFSRTGQKLQWTELLSAMYCILLVWYVPCHAYQYWMTVSTTIDWTEKLGQNWSSKVRFGIHEATVKMVSWWRCIKWSQGFRSEKSLLQWRISFLLMFWLLPNEHIKGLIIMEFYFCVKYLNGHNMTCSLKWGLLYLTLWRLESVFGCPPISLSEV